jgi:hypothetical protein
VQVTPPRRKRGRPRMAQGCAGPSSSHAQPQVEAEAEARSPNTTPIAKRATRGRGRRGMPGGRVGCGGSVEVYCTERAVPRGGRGRLGRGLGERCRGWGRRGRGMQFISPLDEDTEEVLPATPPVTGHSLPDPSIFTPAMTRLVRRGFLPLHPPLVTQLFCDEGEEFDVAVGGLIAAGHGTSADAENCRGLSVWVRLDRMQWGGEYLPVLCTFAHGLIIGC